MVAVDTDHMEHHGNPGAIRTRHHLEYPIDRLLGAKGETTVSVCLPARMVLQTGQYASRFGTYNNGTDGSSALYADMTSLWICSTM